MRGKNTLYKLKTGLKSEIKGHVKVEENCQFKQENHKNLFLHVVFAQTTIQSPIRDWFI